MNPIRKKKEISAGIVVYRMAKEGPRFLLLYHGSQYWNFAKGKIEAEEKSLRTAIRETAEETGLNEKDLIIKRRFKAYEKYIYFRDKFKIFKIVIFYLAETKNREINISDEHEGFGWFLYRDARRLLRAHKDSEEVLRKANDFIRRPHL